MKMKQKAYSKKIKFSVFANKENLKEIRSFVRGQLKHVNAADADKEQVVLAIDEACVNAIVHGNNNDNDSFFDVELELTSEKICVRIYDNGKGTASYQACMEKGIEQLINEKSKGGMGLKLIYSVMDEVNFYEKDNKHVCSLVKVFA